MSILCDEDFHEAIREIDSVLPRSLWEKLNDIAAYLALIGANDEAYVVWKLAYSGLIPIPDPADSSLHSLVAAFCVQGDYPDLANEYLLERGLKEHAPLERRASREDAAVYQALLTWKYATPFAFPPLECLRPALDLARPIHGERSASVELDALSGFNAFIEEPGKFSHSLLDVHLIYADIAHRHDMPEIAHAQLRAWRAVATSLNSSPRHVLLLNSTSNLAFSGALTSTSFMDPADRRATVGEMVCRLVDRIELPAAFEHPMELNTSIWYCALSFEPEDDELRDWEWELNLWTGAAPRWPTPGERYPRVVALSGLASGDATIRIEFPREFSSDLSAENILAFPIRVIPNKTEGSPSGRKGTLFPNSITSTKDDVGFSVPPGEYDVLARLTLEEEAETSLTNWAILLSFFSRGTVAQYGVLRWKTNGLVGSAMRLLRFLPQKRYVPPPE